MPGTGIPHGGTDFNIGPTHPPNVTALPRRGKRSRAKELFGFNRAPVVGEILELSGTLDQIPLLDLDAAKLEPLGFERALDLRQGLWHLECAACVLHRLARELSGDEGA